MAVTSIVMRISGVVAYSDGSHEPFEASLHKGLLSQPSSSVSLSAFSQLMASSFSSDVDAVLAFLPSLVSLSPDAPSVSKTVSDATFFLTGHITEDDRTNSSFAIEFFNSSIDHFPSLTDSVWAKIASDSTFNASAVSLFEAVAGDGNATVASS